mmetsp:Transcript_19947/g.19983  ORF Transcript_19947/g.19983 Transcript_19947/m.19983 type:complete len:125 (-) Transcript_19947:18-392(-)
MARVLMATSYDEQFPADNILSQPTREFWMSTGVYPQEILIQLTPAKSLRSIRFVSTKVRQIVVEGSEGPHLGNFVKIGETEIGDSRDLQRETVEINSTKVFQYVKFVIASGWNDFVSIHSLRFE